MIRKILALTKKDLQSEISYTLAVLFPVLGVLASLLSFFFIDKMFGHKMTPHLDQFGVSYFPYVLLSMALFSYIGVGIHSFSGKLRNEQLQGTLEALLITPTPLPVILISMALTNLAVATLHVVIYLSLGVLAFGIDFSQANIFSAVFVLLLTITSFSSLGIFSAAFIMIFKKGNPVEWVLNSLEGLVGGVYVPVTVLPPLLQTAAKFLPITYAVRAMELAIYQGFSAWQLRTEVGFLFLFSLIFLPLSFKFFSFALNKARRDGSLTQY